MSHFQINQIFADRYILKNRLGFGAYSEVWQAEDRMAGNIVAVKIYAPDKGMDNDGIEVFRREYATVYNITHQNLLRPSHFEVSNDSPFLVLPYCSKGNVSKYIGKMTEIDIVKFLHDVSSGLSYLHEQEPPIIHQDIKPDNILISDDGHYKLTDFGISTRVRSTVRSNAAAELKSEGTRAYMGPERFTDNSIPIKASDVWSLGATTFELMIGDAPFGNFGGLSMMNNAEIPEIEGDFSEELKCLIRSCLEKNTWDRPTAQQISKITRKYLDTKVWDINEIKTKRKQKESNTKTKPQNEQFVKETVPHSGLNSEPKDNELGVKTAPKSSMHVLADNENNKKNYKWLIILLLLLLCAGIGLYFLLKDPKPEPEPEPEPEPIIIVDTNNKKIEEPKPEPIIIARPISISVKKATIYADGIDKVIFEVLQDKNDVTKDVEIFINDKKIKDNVFSTTVPGVYKAYAKKGDIISDVITITAIAVEPITISVKRTTIYADGVDKVTFEVLQNKSNVAKECVIFINGKKINGVTFSTTVPGTYQAYAKMRNVVSDTITITAIEKPVEKPFSIEMVLVKGGTFEMGNSDLKDPDCEYIEKPIHTVEVSDFMIGKYEVTQEQWVNIMNYNPSVVKGDNLPVTNVSWNEVQTFIEKLNEKTNKEYRLPTEAEWEYAAKGGEESGYSYKYSGSNTLADIAWFTANSDNQIHPVGLKKANALGLYDMTGNVYEWCSDWLAAYEKTYQKDPKGKSTGNYKVCRGGGARSPITACRVTSRSLRYNVNTKNDFIGFRLVEVVR